MRMYDIIKKKRDGEALSPEEIRFFVKGYTDGSIPDYQASALTMAIFFRGMSDAETAVLTDAMSKSGDTMDLSCFGEHTVDKHSTGGVGDKTSLIVAPVTASLGATLAKMSGRGLGHTGGTVDKLESIPGYNTALSPEAFVAQVKKIGICLIGQTGNMTPADKKLYALRDVTATVDSIPLIVSSIMSKKLASGAKTIVLDVKVGSGAFMKDLESAENLAKKMVEIGRLNGRKVAAVLTDMSVPLGFAIGNSLEIKEAISVLKGELKGDIRTVSEELAANMIRLSYGMPIEDARAHVKDAIDSGRAFEKMKEWIAAQGGDVSYIDNPEKFPVAKYIHEVKAPKDGHISRMDAEEIGIAGVILGAGRAEKGDPIDFAAGIQLVKKVGDPVKAGETIALLYTNNDAAISDANAKYLNAVVISDEKPDLKPLIFEVIG